MILVISICCPQGCFCYHFFLSLSFFLSIFSSSLQPHPFPLLCAQMGVCPDRVWVILSCFAITSCFPVSLHIFTNKQK
uniref:Putative secreted peptide n=1 Tax=Anopheles braziliensis TaxID=58242 RepID=A0A2M3ZMR2_9DIPT